VLLFPPEIIPVKKVEERASRAKGIAQSIAKPPEKPKRQSGSQNGICWT
jgi:hypothetical protein